MKKNIILILLLNFIHTSSILEDQIDAIMTISASKGYTQEELNSIVRDYGVYSLPELSQSQAAQVINRLQEGENINNMIEDKIEPIIADILEIGMSKYFYLIDGNRIRGTIIDIVNKKCHIETTEGILKIPMTDILEESIVLTKTDDTRYKGALIKEDSDRIILRSEYGDVTILKKEVEKMERFHGGRLAPEVESRKTFEQGEDELIGVFFDNNAFILDPNTFYLSAMSIGYGLTDIFMMTTKFGSSFNGDLNLYPKLRVWHNKTSNREQAVSIGLGLHRAFLKKSIISKYSHAFYIGNEDSTLNILNWGEGKSCEYSSSDNCYNINNFIDPNDNSKFYMDAYIVYSSKRDNPTGRGKVGYSIGFKTSTMLLDIEKEHFRNGDELEIIFKDSFKFPYRLYASFEYDLQKKIKFVGSLWYDNSSRTLNFNESIMDYFGEIGAPMTFDAIGGDYNAMDFDFGFMYSVNNNFRIGLHFQQPYIDIHWEFFEF